MRVLIAALFSVVINPEMLSMFQFTRKGK
jgi:hypothetical protein